MQICNTKELLINRRVLQRPNVGDKVNGTHLTFHQPSRRASSISTLCCFLNESSSGSMLS